MTTRKSGMIWLQAVILLSLATSSALAAQAAPGRETDDISERAEAILLGAYPGDQPGAAAIVVRQGRTLYRGASGMADLELGVPLSPDMVFRLGSITKQFTAAAIMMLAEEGKLSVDDPIEKHLTGYPTQGMSQIQLKLDGGFPHSRPPLPGRPLDRR